MLARRALLLACAALPLGCRRAQAAAGTAGGGWRAARWGMNGAALDTVFPVVLRRLEPPMVFGPFIAERMLAKVELGQRRFAAFLQHRPDRDALQQVLLRFTGGKPVPADFAAVRDALIAELGRPGEARSETDYSGSFPAFAMAASWQTPGTLVVARYVDPKAEAFSRVRKTLTVRYTAA
jgi:hypothetical protein